MPIDAFGRFLSNNCNL